MTQLTLSLWSKSQEEPCVWDALNLTKITMPKPYPYMLLTYEAAVGIIHELHIPLSTDGYTDVRELMFLKKGFLEAFVR